MSRKTNSELPFIFFLLLFSYKGGSLHILLNDLFVNFIAGNNHFSMEDLFSGLQYLLFLKYKIDCLFACARIMARNHHLTTIIL
ncbi:hypothetical protein CIK96_04245 [Prevotella sp. P4-98]|nr:hypothetical protein CIK96_04245 [Prevotella sp. P4-98]